MVPNPGGNGGDSPRSRRVDIFLGTDEHRVNDEAVAALAREPDIDPRGGMPVRPIERDAASGGGEDIVRPGRAVDAVHARGRWPHVRPLDAVVAHPILLPDGTIPNRDGYHRGPGIPARLPRDLTTAVPDAPTRAGATAAVEVLLDPPADFPFETPHHRAAPVAAGSPTWWP